MVLTMRLERGRTGLQAVGSSGSKAVLIKVVLAYTLPGASKGKISLKSWAWHYFSAEYFASVRGHGGKLGRMVLDR